MAFESNFVAFDNAIKEGKERAAAAGGFGPRLNYFSWKDGEVKIVRFLAEPIPVDVAEWVITNDGKSADFLINPEGTNWVTHFGGMSRERGTSGAIVEPKVSIKGVGVAVLRDERPIPGGGGRTEIFDYLNSFTSKKDNQTYQSRFFGIVKLSFGNFWDQLIGIARRNGTICDRDFEIRRVGADMNTKYEISPIEPIEELRDPDVVRQFYGYGVPYNEENPDRYLLCPSTLPEWCEYYSGEERAKRLLTPKAGAGATPPYLVNPALVQSYPTVVGYGAGTHTSGPPGPATYAPAAANPVVVTAGYAQQTLAQQGPPPTVATAISNPGGPWAGAEDEAQAVSSSASNFADLKSKLMPNLNK